MAIPWQLRGVCDNFGWLTWLLWGLHGASWKVVTLHPVTAKCMKIPKLPRHSYIPNYSAKVIIRGSMGHIKAYGTSFVQGGGGGLKSPARMFFPLRAQNQVDLPTYMYMYNVPIFLPKNGYLNSSAVLPPPPPPQPDGPYAVAYATGWLYGTVWLQH